MPSHERIGVQVLYAETDRAIRQEYQLPPGSTVQDALAMAAQSPDFAGVDWPQATVGVFGRVVQRNQRLQQGDRVEIYRPLAEDPKAARRKRAQRPAGRPP
jgi:putative ubiquitin-RnfH superfamily antitoxin RatB of RatAB toxin-antitoxin module